MPGTPLRTEACPPILRAVEFVVQGKLDRRRLRAGLEKAADKTFETTIKRSHTELRSIYVGAAAMRELSPGKVTVLLAFGVLQEFTDFQYCCGVTQALLEKLGASYNDIPKPDAVLIDRATDECLMAEWKKHSSEFKTNHKPEDVDVLVCWHDNESDRTRLPPRVLPLHSVAKKAAETALAEE